MLGIAFGVAFWGWDVALYPLVSAAIVFPPLGSLTLGVWLIPAVAGALLVRRPGAALYTELIAATVEMFLGNQWGAGVLVSAVLSGVVVAGLGGYAIVRALAATGAVDAFPPGIERLTRERDQRREPSGGQGA